MLERFTATTPYPGVNITIIPNATGNPPGKIADAEILFEGGIFAGLKLIGFGIWERRTGTGRNVTFPARQYSVNGERRSFALLRPHQDSRAQDIVREAILAAYAAYESAEAVAQGTAAAAQRARAEAKRAGAAQPLPGGGSVEPDGFVWAADTTPRAVPVARQETTQPPDQPPAQGSDADFPSEQAAKKADAPTFDW